MTLARLPAGRKSLAARVHLSSRPNRHTHGVHTHQQQLKEISTIEFWPGRYSFFFFFFEKYTRAKKEFDSVSCFHSVEDDMLAEQR